MDIASLTRRSAPLCRRSFLRSIAAVGAGIAATRRAAAASDTRSGPRFTIAVDPALDARPLTGRVFVFLSRRAAPEPRLQYNGLADSVPFFGRDVSLLPAGHRVTIDADTLGYPLASSRDLPAGAYTIQALANVYTRFTRADGNTIWVHADRGEGQQFTTSPGNLISLPRRVVIDPARPQSIALTLTHRIPPIAPRVDTPLVKHVRLQSRLLTAFWGSPIFVSAVVLLPKSYEVDGDRRYPTVYAQDHFSLEPPLGFDPHAVPDDAAGKARRADTTNDDSPYDFTQAWLRGDAPPMVAVRFNHPTPFYDDSYAIDSANNGPYGQALMTELIPFLEAHFRLIADGRARFLIGTSTGGWESLALQIFHPDDFNGAWAIAPDPVDFHRFQLGDMYADSSAFVTQHSAWSRSEIPAQRSADSDTVATMREESQLEAVLGSHGRSGEQFDAWNAAYGPVLQDGYPGEMWDKRTGAIDHTVVDYMRDHHFDLRDYLERNWTRIGPSLVNKLHVDVGDDDDYFLNLACYRLQSFLDATTNPAAKAVFVYGRPLKPHGWQAQSTLDYLREMAARAER